MKIILGYFRPYIRKISLQLIIKFLGTIMDLLLPLILAHLIDRVVPVKDVTLILLWGGIMVLCSLGGVTGNILANRMASSTSRDTTKKLRHDLMAKIASLSGSQIDQITISSLETRLTTDSYNVHQMTCMLQRMGIRAPILLIGGLSLTLTLEPVLTLTLIAALPLIGFVIFFLSKKGIPLYKKTQQATDKLVLAVRESASGIRIIKALSKMDYEKERFQKVSSQVTACDTKAASTMAISNPLMNLFLNVGLTFVILIGAFRVNAGLTQAGTIIAFLSYFTIILNALLAVSRMFVLYSKGSASAQRISEVLLLEPDQAIEAGAYHPNRGHICFDHVSFGYTKGKTHLSDINFTLNFGQTLGIIGPTGSGKTTLVKLLLRFYDTSLGEIYMNGQPIRSISFEQLRGMFGVVFQNDTLFADSIRENIAFGRELSDENIKFAAKNAGADFIETLPEQFAHHLSSGGTNVSGGQKQRLLIARALAKPPEILILDDASSALDYKTDAALRKSLRDHYSGITTIIVAQRISSIRHADQILLLEDGCVLGNGTHEHLMKSCSDYREICISQMGGDTYAAN